MIENNIRACAIVLAAGDSRRMGAQKLLLPWRGATVIAHIADELLNSAVRGVFVVTGRDGERIAEALAGRAVTLVSNLAAASGAKADMLSSARCGLRAAPPDCDAALVALGDQPTITTALVNELLRAYAACGKPILVPTHAGRRGHPLLFSMRYRDEILSRHDGVGLRGLLRAHPHETHELPVAESSILADLDCPAGYRRALRALQTPRRETLDV